MGERFVFYVVWYDHFTQAICSYGKKIYFREEQNMESNVPYIEIVPHQCEEECATCDSASKGNM